MEPGRESKVFIYGAGGHGKVVADILLAANFAGLVGFVDDKDWPAESRILGLPVLGKWDWLQREALISQVAVALGIGDNRMRRFVADQCVAHGIKLVTAIHPAATLSRFASLGPGTVVMAGARINPSAQVGAGVIVNTSAVIEHDVEVGDYAHLSPHATMAGAAQLGEMSHLGLGAMVLPGIKVGAYTTVGAGAVVIADLPDHVVAIGVPARIHRRVQN